MIEGGEKFKYGWPDLTLFKDGEALFIEVKTTDRLSIHQINIWERILKPLDINMSVIHLKPNLFPNMQSSFVNPFETN